MHRLTVLSLFVFVIFAQGTAQDSLYTLHQAVGDTIDRKEKSDYDLFPYINNANFSYCVIKQTSNAYYLHAVSVSDSLTVKQVDITELKESVEKINKLLAIYSENAKKDSLQIPPTLTLGSNNPNKKDVNIDINNSKMGSKIIDDANSKKRLESDAARYKNFKQGTDVFGNQMQIQFKK